MRQFFVWLPAVAMAFATAACGDNGGAAAPPAAKLAAVASTPGAGPAVTGDNFGVTLPKPEGWYELSDTEKDAVQDVGVDVVAGDDEVMRRAAKAAKPRSHNLYSYFRYAPGSPVEFNSSVMVVTENVAMAPGIKRGGDYFFHMRKMLEGGGLAFTVKEEPTPDTLDGQSFDRAEMQLEMAGKKVNETLYMTRRGDEVIVVIQNWMTDEDFKLTKAVVDTIKLAW